MTMQSIDQIVALGKDNAEAFVSSGTAAIKGLEEIAKASQVLAQTSAEKMDAAMKALMACKTPAEVAEVQTKLARESAQTAVAEIKKFAELAKSTYNAALAPLNERVQAFQKMAKV